MGIFGRSRPSAPPEKVVTPAGLSTLNLAPVEWWAEHFLVSSGMEASDVAKVKAEYPTETPPPNLTHTFSAGEPANPWTLSMVCAEAAIADALMGYITVAGSFVPRERAQSAYAEGGLPMLVGIVHAYEQATYLPMVHQMVNDKIESSYQNFFVRVIGDYLANYWPRREQFIVRLA